MVVDVDADADADVDVDADADVDFVLSKGERNCLTMLIVVV